MHESPLVLNLGCGTRTANHPSVLNVDWSFNIRIKQSPVWSRVMPLVLDARRRQRLEGMTGRLMAHDLSKGLPFESESVDAVYHSHVLEHLDRLVARGFLSEMRRVLKPGGLCRIVVPDLEPLCRAYLTHIDQCVQDPLQIPHHEEFVAELLEQSVRREAAATMGRTGVRRFAEQVLLGDARRRGETHQWMYDRISLPYILGQAGFRHITVETWGSSRIPGWQEIGLDRNNSGGEYKPGSLYVEAQK